MAATLTLNFADETGPGFQSLMRHLSQTTGGVVVMKGELDEAADSMRRMKSESEQAGPSALEQASRIGNVISGIAHGLELAGQAAQKANQLLNTMAAEGNLGAIDLKNAFGELRAALFDLAEDPGVQEMLHGFAATIRDTVIPAVNEIPEHMRRISHGFAIMGTIALEQLGVVHKGTLDALIENHRIQRDILEDEKERLRVNREIAAAKEVQAENERKFRAIYESFAELQERDRINAINDQKTIAGELATQITQWAELAKKSREVGLSEEEQKKTQEKLEETLRSITRLKARQYTLARDQAREEERIAEATRKAAEAEKEKAAAAAISARLAEEERVAKAAMVAFQAMQAERERQMKALQQSGIVGQVRGSFSRDELFREVMQNRMESVDPAVAEQARRDMARFQVQQRRQRQGIAARNPVQFNISQQEIAKAATDLTNNMVEQAEKSGKLEQATVELFRETANTVALQAERQAQTEDQVNALTRQFESIQQNMRARAQRSGLGR